MKRSLFSRISTAGQRMAAENQVQVSMAGKGENTLLMEVPLEK